jgi:NADH dehydrogenase FAD-containing subunit
MIPTSNKKYANEHPKGKKPTEDDTIKVAGAGNTGVLSYAKQAAKITGKTLTYFKMNPEEAYKIVLENKKSGTSKD